MKKYLVICLSALIIGLSGNAQSIEKTVWWNPANSTEPVIEGQAWPKEVKSFYDRLPARAEKTVRPDVWSLSRQSSGLIIRFRSNSSRITVRYTVNGRLNMHHMPSTGFSGVDLYSKDCNGTWLWSSANYSFNDTIVYQYNNLESKERYHNLGREYRLYLPLYNSVKWMEIGVAEGTIFTPLPLRLEKPVVVYGTSIAQGGCASRPGMAWTAILGRNLDRPLINLGFSGNGRLEPELISLISEIDARLYVLDCMPNMVELGDDMKKLITSRILQSVRQLRKDHPLVPVLLTDHAGYTNGSTNPSRKKMYVEANQIQHEAFALLKSEGINNIYLLENQDINLSQDAMVDGTHPSDMGMQQYALAYEIIIRDILQEPVGVSVTTHPCTQLREPGNYDWEVRHQKLLKMNSESAPRTLFIGNSITHFWSGNPAHTQHQGDESWKRVLEPLGTRNFGFGWDLIENVLWRVYHDELSGYQAERVIICIGTNNLSRDSDEQILEGMELLIKAIKTRQSKADILLLGLYPRVKMEERIAALNIKYALLAGKMNIRYKDAGSGLLTAEGKTNESLFSDGLHPNAEGYNRIAEKIAEVWK